MDNERAYTLKDTNLNINFNSRCSACSQELGAYQDPVDDIFEEEDYSYGEDELD